MDVVMLVAEAAQLVVVHFPGVAPPTTLVAGM